MNIDKVFEALEILSRALEFNDEGEFQSGRLWRIIFNDMVDDKEKAIIEEALTELKAIKESKPSEAIKCLEEMGKYSIGYSYVEELKQYNTIKKYILKAQEQEEVLRLVSQHLSFEYGGTAIIKDFINGTQEMKHIIKVKSKDTGATINVPLDTKQEFESLNHYFEKNIQKQ